MCSIIIEHMDVVHGLSAADRFRAAARARARAEIDEAVAIAELAAEHAWREDAEFDVTTGGRPVRIGADGTPLVDEFLPLEVAGLKAISVTAATWLIRDIVNLKARHPLLWRAMAVGKLPVFRACQLTREVAHYDLTVEEAHQLDEQLFPHVGEVSWPRLLRATRGLIADIAADKVAEQARQARRARFVRLHDTESPAVSYLSARLDSADALAFDAMVCRIADILAERGDDDSADARRAKAIGVLATPARAALMLAEAAGYTGGALRADHPRLLPKTRLFVHVAEESITSGRGVCRVEGLGPITIDLLTFLLGHSRVTVTPVVRPYDDGNPVDCYEIPERIRRRVTLRNHIEVFPHSGRSSRGCDLDHTIGYTEHGPPGQTRPSNLGPLSRKAHRGKTFGGWQLRQPRPGVFWWRSPAGNTYRVTPKGTTGLGNVHDRYRDDPERHLGNQGLRYLLWKHDTRDPGDED